MDVPFYLILIIIISGLLGTILYLYKPNTVSKLNDKSNNNYNNNYKNLGIVFIIISILISIYVLFIYNSKNSLAYMDNTQYNLPQYNLPRNRSWADTISELGGKYLDFIGKNTKLILENPDILENIKKIN